MSTRSTIWLGESKGKCVHIYWKLGEREVETGRITGIPVYLSVDAGDVEKELAIRLPKDMAIRLLTVLSENFGDEVGRVI